jgi:hypothetical protein
MCTWRYCDALSTSLQHVNNSFMQVPELHIVHAVFFGFSEECYDEVSGRYSDGEELLGSIASRVQVPEALKKHHCSHAHVVEEDPDNGAPGEKEQEESCLRVNIVELSDGGGGLSGDTESMPVNNSAASKLFHVSIRVSSSIVGEVDAVAKSVSAGVGMESSKLLNHGISVYTLLHMNVEPALKRLLFKLYLEIPFHVLDTYEQQLILPSNMFAQVFVNPADSSPISRFVDLSLIRPSELHDKSETGMGGSAGGSGVGGASADTPLKSAVEWTISSAVGEISTARAAADTYWHALRRELNSHTSEVALEGRFSFVEHNSDFGFVSYQLAKEFPNATVVSLENNREKAAQHVKMVSDLKVYNNVVCNKVAESDSIIFKNIYESPELFRYQLIARGVLEAFGDAVNLESWGRDLGSVLSSALTTFVSVPSSAQVSLAMSVFMAGGGGILTGPFRPLSDVFGHSENSESADTSAWNHYSDISSHPLPQYRGFETVWLLGSSRVDGGSTQISLTPIYHDTKSKLPILIRCDIVNMTRHVHHHYNYAKDGHTRTYTMRVEVNNTETHSASFEVGDVSSCAPVRDGEAVKLVQRQDSSHSSSQSPESYTLPLGMHPNQHEVVSVRLYRDKDSFPIPYTSIYGITLISILRLGLDAGQRERLFSSFLKLPLYEDMAPWNMVLMGKVWYGHMV